MADSEGQKTAQKENIYQSISKEIVQPFKDLLHTSKALAGLNISYVLEGLTYFGVVTLLAIYFNDYIGLNDINAGIMVSILTAGITLSMLFIGATVDWIGARRAILYSLVFMLAGRILLAAAPGAMGTKGMGSSSHIMAMLGILGIVIGYGVYQPASYAAVKLWTNEKTAAMGYAMLYALMNLGGFLPGIISPPLRKAFGIPGVFYVYSVLTIAGMGVVAFFITKKSMAEAEAIAKATGGIKDTIEEKDDFDNLTGKEKLRFYIKHFPLRDKRFLYFIFILIPVQTLFAHNWLTIPQYTSRAFSGFVSDNFEFFSNFNPILIFILTPMVAAFTAERNTYKMMILGTFVMASPTFLLALGPNIYTLFAFLIIMTIGEAVWQPRFLQWVAEIAPKGMTGIYMGIGQFPWFLTKMITGLYSGWFLTRYCPRGVPPEQMHTEFMWFIYGLIAVISPVGLILAKGWMQKGFKTKHAE
ncbi:MAG: MFS transporter [Ignavibacteria bacterium]